MCRILEMTTLRVQGSVCLRALLTGDYTPGLKPVHTRRLMAGTAVLLGSNHLLMQYDAFILSNSCMLELQRCFIAAGLNPFHHLKSADCDTLSCAESL